MSRRYYPSKSFGIETTTFPERIQADKFQAQLPILPSRIQQRLVEYPSFFWEPRTLPAVPTGWNITQFDLPNRKPISYVQYGSASFSDTRPIVPFIPYQDMTFKFAQRNVALYQASFGAITVGRVRNLPLLGVG